MRARIQSRKLVWLTATAVVAITGFVVIWLAENDSQTERASRIADPMVDRVTVSAPVEPGSQTASVERYPASRVAARAVAVVFPNGVSVSVQLRGVPSPGVPISGSRARLTDFYDQLAGRALAGEAAAAHELARQLQKCKGAYSDEASLNAAIMSLREQGFVTYADGRTSIKFQHDVGIERIEESELRRPFEFCRGIGSAQLEDAEKWQQMAMEAGYYWAWQDWARNLRGTPQELEAWNSLWLRGHASVLQALTIRYREGVAGSPPDYIRAYAYRLIEFGLMQAAFSQLPSPTPTQQMMLVTVEDTVRYAGSFLTPGETETAVALAVELLRNNQNCCIGRWH